jgi:hypothetical protein
MEEKVVAIINKIKSGKDCHKEIEALVDRTKKVSMKELHNKYFVSGIQLISTLARGKDCQAIFTPSLALAIQGSIETLKKRLLSDLDDIQGFEVNEEPESDFNQHQKL